jgi:spermidine synthase
MRKVLSLGFLLMGFGFTVTQGLLIRELLVAFFGNELSIGLILGSWLVLEALGSGLLGRLATRWGHSPISFAALQVLFALFLPLCLYAAYASRSLVGAIPGEGVGLVPIAWSSFLILSPLALVDGAMFAFGCQAYARLTGAGAPAIGRVYVLEALGGIAGGLIFTYLFIPFLAAVQMVLLLAGLNLLSAGLILGASIRARSAWPRITLGAAGALPLLVIAGLSMSPLATQAQRWAAGQQWAGFDLVYSENSVYGNVAVVQQQGQYTFFADGIPILTAPVPDVALTEELVHLSLLYVPEPRRALVLSGGLGGILDELSKYPLDRIDYAELDPLLIEAARQFPTALTESELGDPRLTVENVDGRLLVRNKASPAGLPSRERYNLVIVNLPYPSTLQLNRFYTVEFFQMVRRLLSEDGVLAMGVPGTLSYMSDELRDLNAMAHHTLRRVFPYVKPIPGDVTLWLASPSAALEEETEESLVERWESRGLETKLVTPPHIRLRLADRYEAWFWASLAERDAAGRAGSAPSAGESVNQDLHPVGLFFGLAYWNALFSPSLARAFAAAGSLNLWTLGLVVLICGLLFSSAARFTSRGRRAIVPLVIGATGFSGMAADLIVIFAFQTLYGYVFHWVGLLITAFMAGLSLGGFLMTRRLARNGGTVRTLRALEAALVVYWVLLPLLLAGLYTRLAHPWMPATIQGLLFLLNALAGLLVGAQFPLANRLWLADEASQQGSPGALYASDLAGAFLGSILVSVLLIPVLGIVETCLLVAAVKLASLLATLALPARA